MGRIEEDALESARDFDYNGKDFRVVPPSTDVIRLETDEHLNISAILKAQSRPVISLDLLDDLERITDFSRRLSANQPTKTARRFLLKSDVPGIFALGGDLALFRYYIERQDAQGLKRYARKAVRAIWALLNGLHSECLTVSFVNGEAQGGGFEAAIACNVMIATKNASFGFPEALFGLFPGMGAAPLLTARSDAHAAKTLLSTSGRYPAEMLYEIGIVDYLIDERELGDLLSQLMTKVTESKSREEFTARFDRIRYEDLVDTVDDWASQAIRLEGRKIDVMGVILKAQNRLLNKRLQPTISIASSPLSISDFDTHVVSRSGPYGPLVIAPKSGCSLDARRALNFLKDNSTWIEQNLTSNGGVLLQEFPGNGVKWLKSAAAALNGASHSTVWGRLSGRKFVAPGIARLESTGNLPAFESGALPFPPSKTLLYRDSQPLEGGGIRLVDGRRVLEKLQDDVLEYFTDRTLVYTWNLQNERRRGISEGVTWQYVFGTNERSVVANECFESGLFCAWDNEDNSLRIWRETGAIGTHPITGQRSWRNAIHDFCRTTQSGEGLPIERTLTFRNNQSIDQAAIDAVSRVISEQSIRIRWNTGDLLILDANLVGFSCELAKGHEETYLMPT